MTAKLAQLLQFVQQHKSVAHSSKCEPEVLSVVSLLRKLTSTLASGERASILPELCTEAAINHLAQAVDLLIRIDGCEPVANVFQDPALV